MTSVAPTLPLAMMVAGVMLGLGVTGGRLLFDAGPDPTRGGGLWLGRVFLGVAVVAVAAGTGLLIASYAVLDWRIVLGIHGGFGGLGLALGLWLKRIWGRGGHPLLLEAAIFHALAVAAAAWLLLDLLSVRDL